MADKTRSSPLPITGGMNLSADPATAATTRVANLGVGPAGENAPRPGLVDTTVTGMSTSPVIGMWQWRGFMILVTADRKIWAVAEGSPTVAADITGVSLPGTLRPVFAEDDLPSIVIAGGGAPIRWTGAGLTALLVAIGQTPAATHIAYLGQRLIANDLSNPTTWFWSDLFSGGSALWNPLSFDNADASPDPIVGIYSTIREAYVFGQKSIQVYTTGSDPLNPWDNAIVQAIGCSAPYSPVNVDGPWMFLDDRRRIVVSSGREFQDVSNDIAVPLRGFSTVSDCWSYREDISHATYYVFKFPTEQREFEFDPSDKTWMERDYYSPLGQIPLPTNAQAYWPRFTGNYFGSSTTGAVYKWDETVFTDLGQPLVMERVTGWLDHGTAARKRSVRVRARLRRGTGTPVSEEVFEVRVADDGGPWGGWESLPLGESGDNTQVADMFFGGVFRQRRYNFRYTGTAGTALLSAEELLIDLAS